MGTTIKNLYLNLKKIDMSNNIYLKWKWVKKNKTIGCRKKTIHIKKINNEIVKTLNDLPKDVVIQIGDTYYKKGGLNFAYEYFNQSKDYKQDLDDILNEEGVYIMLRGSCV